jgi:tetrapyrrole methylase family protein/MazG family protein
VLDALVAEARDRWGLDLAAGLQLVAAEGITATPIEASRPLLIAPLGVLAGGGDRADRGSDGGDGGDASGGAGLARPALPEPLPGRHGPAGRRPLDVLRRLYPDGHPVTRLGGAGGTTVGELTAADLERPLYLAPVSPELAIAGPWAMPYISHRLRQPDGCPWDREQTHASLRKHLLEEAYEVYDALEDGATPALAEELGDLLLQIVLHAQLAAEAGIFDLTDVDAAIARKIVRRHPHVFGDAVAKTAADVSRQWERIKGEERAEASEQAEGGAGAGPPKSALDGISASMPALAAGQEMQERAAALGYDWPDVAGVLDKVAEELAELAEATTPADRQEEFGDLLLVVTNVGRKLGIESEAALRAANTKFRERFRRVERMVAERGVAMRDLDFATLDGLWDAAKAEERFAIAGRERRP